MYTWETWPMRVKESWHRISMWLSKQVLKLVSVFKKASRNIKFIFRFKTKYLSGHLFLRRHDRLNFTYVLYTMGALRMEFYMVKFSTNGATRTGSRNHDKVKASIVREWTSNYPFMALCVSSSVCTWKPNEKSTKPSLKKLEYKKKSSALLCNSL